MAKKSANKSAKKKATKPKVNRLGELYESLHDDLEAALASRRRAHKNAEMKGDAAEQVWIDLLVEHLPHRYRVGKGFVIDPDGRESEFIDVIIYDRQYTPAVFARGSQLYVPAESVYAVLEAKQELTRAHLIYAGKKAASVRRLRRTSATIVHAGGRYEGKEKREPFRIVAGLLTYKSSWMPAFGNPFEGAIGELANNHQLDFGLAAADGYFEVQYAENANPTIKVYPKKRALAAFMMRFLAHLQTLGTVTAIDYNEYSKILK